MSNVKSIITSHNTRIIMNLVFYISEDGSEIELNRCASSKTSVKSSQKYFVRTPGQLVINNHPQVLVKGTKATIMD